MRYKDTQIAFGLSRLVIAALKVAIVTFVGALLWPSPASANGFLPVMNFQRPDYDFGTQNWDMTQDMLGKIYVANYNGMMVFDGLRWRHYYLPNFTTVRSLLYDNDTDRIYAGGSEEFGYFYPEESTGRLKYHSLSAGLPANGNVFSEVWDIFKINGNIIFRCDNCIFSFSHNNTNKLIVPGRISSSCAIGRKVFLGMEDGRIFSLKDGNLGQLKEECALNVNKIVAILPFDDSSLLACTPTDGVFLIKEGVVTPFINEFTRHLDSIQIFCAKSIDGVYVFGTVTDGAYIWDTNNNVFHRVNKDSGLKNNTVLNVCFDRYSNPWLCLDNGLAYVALDSPCRRLVAESASIGAGYASAMAGDNLLLGTNQGLYIKRLPSNGFDYNVSDSPVIKGQVWSITPCGEAFFINADRGLYSYGNDTFKHVKDTPGVYKTLMLGNIADKAIASTYDSFHLLQKFPDGWHDTGKISGGNELKGDFFIDDYNRVWLSHWQKGIYMLPFNESANRFTSCNLLSKNNGLPANDNNTLCFFEGAPIASTYTGIFNLDAQNNKALPNPEISDLIKPGRKGHLKELSDGIMALIDEDGLIVFSRNFDGKFVKKEISGPGLYHEIIPGFTHVRKSGPEELMVSTETGFTIVDLKKDNTYPHGNKPFVSNIYANHDSLIYQAPLSAREMKSLILPPELNSLKFEFGYPECNFGENTLFSSYLENYEKQWSPFTAEGSREYTHLSEGKYILHLRVKDNYSGEILESSFGFMVNPPWFRSVWAKGLYTVLSFLVLILIFASVRRKMINIRKHVEKRKELEMEDLRKESERDAMLKDMEIAGLKNEQLEQEIKYKSDELSATTMSLINKNEILREIGDQISKIKKLAAEGSVAAIQKNLTRLQASIEENITKDADWNAFNKNFDQVYGDYVKRLLKLHPDLTTSEKRLCCYIRMGLQSKEIAPLINISFKSVEMARYRLRKKMNLANDEKLSEYLASI